MGELTTEQIAALERDLRALREELCAQIDRSEGGAGTVELDDPIGRLTRMDAMQQQSMVRANRRAAQLRLTQVDAALRRCAAGDYGECVDCGDDIAFGRLKARPESPLCIDCQGALERRR